MIGMRWVSVLLRQGLLPALLLIVTAAAATGPARALPADLRVSQDPQGRLRCDGIAATDGRITIVATQLAGVPALLRIPRHIRRPPIILWHGFGPPASGKALMEALPLDDVAAVKVYPDLPLFGRRAPSGGRAELQRRQMQDFAMLLFRPGVVGAAEELPAVLRSLQQRGCMTRGDAIDLFGFSAGGAAALSVLEQGRVAVHATVLVNASTGLDDSVQALVRATGKPYAWTAASRDLASRTDAKSHAADIARGDPPRALLIVQGESDTVLTASPAIALHASLQPHYPPGERDRLQLLLMPGFPHDWVDDPAAVASLQRATARWFNRYR